MNNFVCEKCGAEVIEDSKGRRVVFCEHYAPQDGKKVQSTFYPTERHTEHKKLIEKIKPNGNQKN